jgi:hypothetical protein
MLLPLGCHSSFPSTVLVDKNKTFHCQNYTIAIIVTLHFKALSSGWSHPHFTIIGVLKFKHNNVIRLICHHYDHQIIWFQWCNFRLQLDSLSFNRDIIMAFYFNYWIRGINLFIVAKPVNALYLPPSRVQLLISLVDCQILFVYQPGFLSKSCTKNKEWAVVGGYKSLIALFIQW